MIKRIINKENNYEAWKQAKLNDIGGSDIASIMGLLDYENATKQAIWNLKKGITEYQENRNMYFGNLLESHIVEKIIKDDFPNLKIEQNKYTFEHEKYNFLTATPDVFVESEETSIIEVKTTASYSRFKTGLPIDVQVQVNWQLGILMLKNAKVCAIIAGNWNNPKYFDVNFDSELYQNQIAFALDFKKSLELDVNPYMGNTKLEDLIAL